MTADNLTFSLEIDFIPDIQEGRMDLKAKMKEVAAKYAGTYVLDPKARPIISGLSKEDVENALNALRYNRERMERLQAAAQAASNANLLARQRYASGLIDFRTVLDTQRTLLSAQSELETTRATHSADHVRLYKALGGGWTPSPDGTVATASSAVTPSAPATVAEPATHR